MSDLNGPQVDERPPGYGCTKSFGMLGPSRLVLQWSDVPPAYAFVVGGLVLSHQFDLWFPTFGMSVWSAIAEEWQADVSLICETPATGDWRINAQVYSGGGVLQTVVEKQFVNFEWQFPMVNVDDVPAGAWGFATLWRIGEWQTVTARFPNAVFPDEF